MRVCVYCASSAQAPAHFGDAAYALGRLLATHKVTVVFGGGGFGSMGRLADGVHSLQGEIIGIMPHFMRKLEWSHPKVDTYVWTETMAERKARLIESTDGVIALPGGCGTFEELLEAITLKRLGLYAKPIVVVNQLGFYDPLLSLFERSVQNQFMDERHLTMFSVVETVEQVIHALQKPAAWDPTQAREFATKRK